MFNGVSRQPHTVRLPSQLQEADNVLPSVTSGGVEKRPPVEHLAAINADTADDWAIHVIDRDPTEQYVVLINTSGEVKVYDAQDGSEQTVNAYSSDVETYLSAASENLAFVTVADYTFVVNRTIETAMDTVTGGGSITGYELTYGDLPATGSPGDIYKVTNGASELDDYYVTWDATSSSWIETTAPGLKNDFDETTMPHQIVRETNGTFTVSAVTWSSRSVGDLDTVPEPSFIGRTINDIFFQKNRLGFIADEGAYFSQAGDYFNLWPAKSIEVLDTDPIDVTATTNKVTILKWAVPFRKSLFLSADRAQFELSSNDTLTPFGTTIDLATSYVSDNIAKPVSLGDELYFSSALQGRAILFEYFYDDDTVGNTAVDVTKHVEGFVSGSVVGMTGSPSSGTVVLQTDDDSSKLYLYRVYWSGDEKAQSAWFSWSFDGVEILAITTLDEYLYMVTKWGDSIHFERVPMEREASSGLGFAVHLDHRVEVTGVYDAGNDETTWTIPYEHDEDLSIVLGSGFASGSAGRLLESTLTYPTATTVKVSGDFSDDDCYIGKRYEMTVEFSRQYVRGGDNKAQILGRLQLKTMSIAYENSGYFEVHVTPALRDVKIFKMTGRVLGTQSNVIGQTSISSGRFSFPVKSRGDTVKIEVKNDTHLPTVLNSASWIGFYNEISKEK